VDHITQTKRLPRQNQTVAKKLLFIKWFLNNFNFKKKASAGIVPVMFWLIVERLTKYSHGCSTLGVVNEFT